MAVVACQECAAAPAWSESQCGATCSLRTARLPDVACVGLPVPTWSDCTASYGTDPLARLKHQQLAACTAAARAPPTGYKTPPPATSSPSDTTPYTPTLNDGAAARANPSLSRANRFPTPRWRQLQCPTTPMAQQQPAFYPSARLM